jgi:hypothetical protein
MKKQLLFLIIFLVSKGICAQTNLKDNDIFCNQYSKILEFISNDSSAKKEFPFKPLIFQLDNKVRYGIGGPIMNKFYVAQTLGIETANLSLKDSTVIALFTKLEIEESYNINMMETSKCLSELQDQDLHYNVRLRFERKNEKVVFVDSSRIYDHQRHSNGIFYLFFFDNENNIVKAYSEDWIE